jgi:gliding motility-associated-like protein
MILLLNKKTIRKTFLLFTLLISLIAKAQDFIWTANTNQQAYGYNEIKSIVTDSKGNIYSTGSFGGTVDFDPSTNSSILTAIPTSTDFTNSFILKLDKNKNFKWVKQIASIWADGGRSIILDKNENIIITGLATGSQIDLNPDPVDQYLINNSTSNPGSYIIKLDSDGNFIFGNYYPGAYADESTLDNDDNIITTGVSGGTNVDFDAGNGIYNLNTKATDIFILKNNSNGAFIWAKNIGGNRYDYPLSLVCDNLNNIILKGNFENNIDFLNTNYISDYNCNFICKINPDGQDLWLRKLGTVSGMISNEDKSVKIDNQNNIYFNTNYSSTFTPNFNNTNISFTSNSVDSILFKLDENGEYIWHNSIYGDERQELYSLDLDNNQNLYLTAFVNGKTFINNNCNQVFPNNNTHYSYEGVLLRFNPNGKFVNFKNIMNSGFSIQCDFEDNILIGGNFRGGDFDPSPSNSFFMYSSYSDGFTLKLAPCTSAIPEGEPTQIFCSSKNPTIADLKPCSEIVDWYDSINSTLTLSKNTLLIDGHTYYATYRESCSGTVRLAVTVSITQAPQIPIASNLKFCKSDNAKLSDILISGQNIKWYGNLIGDSILPNTTILTDNVTYFATQTVNGCESIRTPLTVNINNAPSLIITSPQTFCIQQNATINDIAATGQNIKWYDQLTAGNLLTNTSLLQDGKTYYASQTINGCESERIPVIVNIQDTQAPTGNETQRFCTSQNPTLSTIVVVGTTIKWYDSATLSNLLLDATPLVDGKTYYATQTVNNCESANRLAVTISLISSLPANDYDFSLCDDLNDGKEYVKLEDYNSHLILNTANYTFAYYESLLDAENEVTSTKITTASNYKLSLGDNKIYVRINSNTPCYAIALLKITLLPKPIISNQDIVPICENKSILIDAGSGGDSYLWSNGKTTQTITVDNPGDLSVTVTKNYDAIYCSSDKKFTVKTSNIAKITAIETKDWTDNDNTITVFVTGSGDFEYSIDGHNYQDSNTFSGVNSGEYIVQVRDKNGCGTATEEVYLLMYPKFFTPNGDGFNDTWEIKSSDSENGLTIKIFDRYGKLIITLDNNSNGWDGTYTGQPLPATDYWFIVTRKNGKEYKGHFSLKR